MEKDNALDAALSQIERAFGKGSIMRLGQNSHIDIEAISTGYILSKDETQMITDFCCENADKFKGIPLETCLEVLDE